MEADLHVVRISNLYTHVVYTLFKLMPTLLLCDNPGSAIYRVPGKMIYLYSLVYNINFKHSKYYNVYIMQELVGIVNQGCGHLSVRLVTQTNSVLYRLSLGTRK